MTEEEELSSFLRELYSIWKKEIYQDYWRFKIIYENDLYATLFYYLKPFIKKQTNWHLLINLGGIYDLLLVKYKNQNQLKKKLKQINDLRNDIGYDSDLIAEYLIYFEVKSSRISSQDVLDDLIKLRDAVCSKGDWQGYNVREVVFICIKPLESVHPEIEKKIEKIKAEIDQCGRYLELIGFANPKKLQNDWGFYDREGRLIPMEEL